MLYPTNSHYIPFHVCWRRRGSPSRISGTPQRGHLSSFFPSRQEMVMGPDMSRVANPTVAILAKSKGYETHSWSNLIRFWVLKAVSTQFQRIWRPKTVSSVATKTSHAIVACYQHVTSSCGIASFKKCWYVPFWLVYHGYSICFMLIYQDAICFCAYFSNLNLTWLNCNPVGSYKHNPKLLAWIRVLSHLYAYFWSWRCMYTNLHTQIWYDIYIYIYSIHIISTYEVTIPSVGCISPFSPAPLTSASFRTSSLAGLLTGKAWRTAGDQVN